MAALKIDLDSIIKMIMAVIIILIIVVVARYCENKKAPGIRKNIEELYLNGKFSIGSNLYEQDIIMTSTITTELRYRFETSTGLETKFLGSSVARQISRETDRLFRKELSACVKLGSFLVLYEDGNPKNAILLLDHPIKNDLDFERYKVEIEEKRKDKSWRGYE